MLDDGLDGLHGLDGLDALGDPPPAPAAPRVQRRAAREQAGALLRDARERAGLSQRELGLAAGTRQEAVCRVERGTRSPSLDLLDALLAPLGHQLLLSLEPLDADVDRAVAQLEGLTLAERLLTLRIAPDELEEGLAGVPHRVVGAAAAFLHGAPVSVERWELEVPEAGLDGLAGWLDRMHAQRWDLDWEAYTTIPPRDPREPGPLRWWCLAGEVVVRVVPELGPTVTVEADGTAYPVVPLLEIGTDDPWLARLLVRLSRR